MARAIGRSNPDPIFRNATGVRLTTIRRTGKLKPELVTAAVTRSLLSMIVRQVDDVEGTESDGNIDFHIHRMSINSEYRSRIRFGNHSSGLAVDSFCLLFLLYYRTNTIDEGLAWIDNPDQFL